MKKQITVNVTIYDVTMEVSGTYFPEEPSQMYDGNMEGHPGYAAEFEIDSVQLEGIEIEPIISDEVYTEIIEQVIKNQESCK
jgi:hypothetical protein